VVVWGIAAGTPERPQVIPVPPEPFTTAHAQAALPATPREVFRLAARCAKGSCPHWRPEETGAEGDGACSLVQRVIAKLPKTAPQKCGIRSVCRWFAQEGLAACRICPGVVTDLGELPQDQASEDQVRFF